MNSQTHITDYIPAQVLEREGFYHVSEKEKFLERLGEDELARCGYGSFTYLRGVTISVRTAAKILRNKANYRKEQGEEVQSESLSSATLSKYIKDGYLKSDEEGKVELLEVLAFNYEQAKRKYLDTK